VCRAALLDMLGNAPPHRVVAVLGALPDLSDLYQPLCHVVAVASLSLAAAFFLRVPLRGVTDLGFYRRIHAERYRSRVLNELVISVVIPGAGLVGAAQAVTHRVVAVLLFRQSQCLQGVVRADFCQAADCVIAVFCFTRIRLDLGDVAGQIILVLAVYQNLLRTVFYFDAAGALQGIEALEFDHIATNRSTSKLSILTSHKGFNKKPFKNKTQKKSYNHHQIKNKIIIFIAIKIK